PVHFAVRSGAEVGKGAGEGRHPAPFLHQGTHGSHLMSTHSTTFKRTHTQQIPKCTQNAAILTNPQTISDKENPKLCPVELKPRKPSKVVWRGGTRVRDPTFPDAIGGQICPGCVLLDLWVLVKVFGMIWAPKGECNGSQDSA
ncbi:hypothetical protein KC19_7G080900, partial [Ceratodon purpureus]